MKLKPTYLIALLILFAAAITGCNNPVGPSTGANSFDDGEACLTCSDADGGDGGGGGTGSDGGGAVDVPPVPITISFVLDTDTGDGFSLSTSATAPAPITATAGVPVRLNQGIGFTALASGGGAPEPITFHASGWSTRTYSEQFAALGSGGITGSGYYLPTYEATFTSDTTLYVRWVPDNMAVRLEYQNPTAPGETVLGPVLFGGDSIQLETWAQFRDRLSPPWEIPTGHGVLRWQRENMSASEGWNPLTLRSILDFFPSPPAEGPTEMQILKATYVSAQVHTVTFNYNGATGGIGDSTREAFDNVQLPSNPGWTPIVPTRENLRFAGWFTALEGGTRWSNGTLDGWENGVRAFNDVALYARWEADVTFVLNNGTANSIIPVQVDAGSTPTVTPPVANPAYAFDQFMGWYQDTALSTPAGGFSVTGHTTFYAGYEPQYTIGSTGPGGGKVYYYAGTPGPRASAVPASGWMFLEAAASDLPTTHPWGLYEDTGDPNTSDAWWRPYANSVEYNANNVLGGGINFTNQILGRIDAPTSTYTSTAAATAARNYNGGGQSDWYLPSGPELQEMNNHRTLLGLAQGAYYWSSVSRRDPSVNDPNRPFNQAFVFHFPSWNTGIVEIYEEHRSWSNRVRPVRRF